VPASGFYFLGPRVGDHNMWHGGGTPEAHVALARYNAERVAYLRQRLGAFREGAGTAADSTLILMYNEAGGQHHNGYNDIWLLLLGTAGGYFPRRPLPDVPALQHCVSDAFVSVANAMGLASVQRFGQQQPAATRSPLMPVLPLNKGPLPGLV
jgi:hypothetical protein